MDAALHDVKAFLVENYHRYHGYVLHPITIASFVVLLLVLLYWNGLRKYYGLQRKINLPGPKPLPYVGSFLEARKLGGLHLAQIEFMKRYGKVYSLCLGRAPSIVVGEPELIKQIMVKEFPKFRNRMRPTFKPPPPMSETLINVRDEKWKQIRNTLTPTFTGLKIKQMIPLMEKAADTFVSKLQGVAGSGKSVNINAWFTQLTLDVILSSAFGVQLDVQTNPGDKMMKKAKLVFRQPLIFSFLASLPFGKLLVLLFRGLTDNLAPFVKLASDIIQSRRQQAEQGIVGRQDMVHLMLTAHKETGAEGARKLSDNEIMAQSVVFLLAGHETSSNTLTFTIYHLALNPEIQEKLRTEIETAIQSNPDSSWYDLVHSIEYLNCVISEAQRLSPPAYVADRECAEPCTINGVHFPKGVTVSFPIYGLHHDPTAWPDVDKFDPERFRGPASQSRHPFQFIPFGGGPRNCIGMRFALIEIKLVLVKVLRKFRFVRSPETQVPVVMVPGATLMARDGVHLRVELVK